MKPGYLSWKLALQLIGVITFVFFLLTINVRELIDALSKLDAWLITLVICLVGINLILKGVRWQYLVKKYTNKKISIGQATGAIVVGVAAGSIFPGRVEPAKPMLLKTSYGVQMSEGMSAMVVERVFDLLALILIFSLTAIILFGIIEDAGIALLGVIVLTVAFSIGLVIFVLAPQMFNRVATAIVRRMPFNEVTKNKLDGFLDKFFQSIKRIHDLRSLTVILTLSLIATFIEVIRLYVIFHFLGEEVSMIILGFALCFGVLTGIASLIPGGVGVNELTESNIIDKISGNGTLSSTSIIVLIDRIFAFYALVVLGGAMLLLSDYLFQSECKNDEKKNK